MCNLDAFSFESTKPKQVVKEGTQNMNREEGKTSKGRLNRNKIIKIAHNLIESKGFKLSDYEFRIYKKNRFWEVHYIPIQKDPTFILTGGGFIVVLKEDGSIVKVMQGQ